MDTDTHARDPAATAPGPTSASVPARPRPSVDAARSALAPPPGRSAFVPLLLLALAFAGWLAFQAVQQWGERQQLAALQAGIDTQEAASKKLRTSLDAVATSTAKLADAGNANAKLVVDELKKRGITINASGASQPPP